MERQEKLSNFWEKMRILKILQSVAYGGNLIKTFFDWNSNQNKARKYSEELFMIVIFS